VLNGEGCEPGIADARSARSAPQAQIAKDRPMSLAGFDNLAMRLTQQIVAKSKCFFERTCFCERSLVCRDTDDGRKRELRNTEPRIA